jgi:flagellar hook-basal body complex protein FliE
MVNLVLNAVSALPAATQLLSAQLPAPKFDQVATQFMDVMKQAETSAVQGMQGQVPMQDVVMKVMEAERMFAAAMAVREKAVSAYLELSRMQI